MVTTDQRLKSAGIEIHLSLKPDFSLHFLLETPELKPFVFLSYMENLVIICNNTLIDTKTGICTSLNLIFISGFIHQCFLICILYILFC